MNDDPDSPCLNVIVRIEDEAWPRDLPEVQALAVDAAVATLTLASPERIAGSQGIEVGLLLTSDNAIQALNRHYRGFDRPTNVLAFEAGDSQDAARSAEELLLLGDVVLARETLLREARDQGKPPHDHLRHLVVHGVLHLLGFDHEADDDAARMEATEVAVLERLGIADPYAAIEGDARAPS